MSLIIKVAPVSPSISTSSDSTDKNVLHQFKLKSTGTGAATSTLVESDSLSSYSWPEETSRQNQAGRKSGQKIKDCATHYTKEGETTDSALNKLNGPDTCLEKDDIIICIDNNPDSVTTKEPSYVQAYMKFMYWLCISPFDPMENADATDWSRYRCALNVIQKIGFTIITTLSILQSFFEVKYLLLFNLSYGNLESFINMSFFIMNLAIKVYFVYLFLLQNWKFARMFSSHAELRAFRMKNLPYRKACSSMKYAITLGTSTLLVSLIHTIWTVGLTEWTPAKTILHHSMKMGRGLFVWTTDDMENDLWLEEIDLHYGNNLKANFLLGLFRMIMFFCSSVQMDVVTNLMLTNAETLKEEMYILKEKISNPTNDVDLINLDQFLAANGDWAHFQCIKKATNDNNNANDALMKYKHANNLMLFVYFVLNVFDGDFSLAYLLRLTSNIVKTSYTYRIATQASSLNEEKRKWIRRLAWKSTDKLFLDRVPLIMDELDREPVGMGTGQFMIDESFLYRFVGSVGSVFVLQAQSRESSV